MTKAEFLDVLSTRLCSLPQSEVLKYTNYYSEQIEDRKDEGMTEAQAIDDLEDINVIIEQILEDYNQSYSAGNNNSFNANSQPQNNGAYSANSGNQTTQYSNNYWNRQRKENLAIKIILVVVTFPVWIAVLSAVFGVFVTVWSIVLSLFVVAFALGVAAIATLVAIFIAAGQGFAAVAILFGVTLLLTGLAVLLCIGAVYATIGLGKFTVFCCKGIASWVTGKKYSI